jgi:uncharacterized protein
MVLANDVTLSGSILLNKNTPLDASSIDLLIRCSITDVEISEESTHPVESSPPVPEESETLAEPVFHSNPPRITVTVHTNATAAQLVVEPTTGEMQSLDRTMILEALREKGVVYGIKETRIDKLIERWCKLQRRYEITAIAEAAPAVPGREGNISMEVRYLNLQQHCDAAREARYYWEIADRLPHVDHIHQGEVIGVREVDSPPVPGKNVLGEPIFSEETVTCSVTLDKGAAFDKKNNSILAQCEGIAYRLESVIGVVPLLFDGTYEVTMDTDEMTVYCKAHPAGPGGTMPGKEEILRQLKAHSVTFGISQKDIGTLVTLCREGACPVDPFIIARGIPPINGNDGTFHYHFNTETSLSPAIDTEGHADYKSIDIFTTVGEGEKLVSLVPPTSGSDGTTVTGRIIPSKPGSPVKLPKGLNTAADSGNPEILIASIEGIVRLSGGLVEICEGYFVEGDVDFSTGDISYNKTVVVNGDVKAGFNVHCGGDLQVNGTMEDSHITVGGNVLSRFGFVGQGKGCIDAKGDVNLGFLKNQQVNSFRNITIAKEAINGTLRSRGTIQVHGRPLSIAGGEVTAKNKIIAHTVGNHTGIRTLLQVGIDYLIVDELEMIDKQCRESGEQREKESESLALFRKRLTGRKKLTSHEQKELTRLTQTIRQLQQQCSVLEERWNIVSAKRYHLEDAEILIEHAAYPGTLFKFGDRHYLLKEELAGPKRVRYIDQVISILA